MTVAQCRISRLSRQSSLLLLSIVSLFSLSIGGVHQRDGSSDPFGSPLPKHHIDLEKVRAELKSRLDTTSLCAEDVALIRKALVVGPPLKSPAYINLVCLWMKLYNDHKRLEKIARGNLKGHGWEYSSADEFNPSDAELGRSYELDEKTIGAFRRGLYLLLRKRKGAPSKGNPWHSFRAIGISTDGVLPALKTA